MSGDTDKSAQEAAEKFVGSIDKIDEIAGAKKGDEAAYEIQLWIKDEREYRERQKKSRRR